MSKQLREVMTAKPIAIGTHETCATAAQRMAAANVGDVLIQEKDGKICGILTDRDIVVRTVAKGRDPAKTPVGEVCTRNVASLAPTDDVDRAIDVMKERAVRRVPVVEAGKAVGIVSLGDLARVRDPESVLGRVSAARPSN